MAEGFSSRGMTFDPYRRDAMRRPWEMSAFEEAAPPFRAPLVDRGKQDPIAASMEEIGIRRQAENERQGQLIDTLEARQRVSNQLNPGIGRPGYLSPMERRQVVAGEMGQDRRQYQLLRRAYQGYARQGRGRRGDPEANLRAAAVLGQARDAGLNLSGAYNSRAREAEVRDQLSGAYRESIRGDMEEGQTRRFMAQTWRR